MPQTEAHVAMQNVSKRPNAFVEIAKFSIAALLIITPFRLFVAQPFIVDGASMEPTFEQHEYLVVDQLTYRIEEPKRGDVIIFKYHLDPSRFFIKRIVGLPGETIKVGDGLISVFRDDQTVQATFAEPYIADVTDRRQSTQTVELDEGEYYVLGDNRSASSDSRVWGPLPERFIVGRALLRLFPFGDAEVLPGKYDFIETQS